MIDEAKLMETLGKIRELQEKSFNQLTLVQQENASNNLRVVNDTAVLRYTVNKLANILGISDDQFWELHNQSEAALSRAMAERALEGGK